MSAARSLASPSTLIASAALARPGPIAWAISAPRHRRGKAAHRAVGQGDGDRSAARGASLHHRPRDLAEGERGGNLLHPEIGEIGAPQHR